MVAHTCVIGNFKNIESQIFVDFSIYHQDNVLRFLGVLISAKLNYQQSRKNFMCQKDPMNFINKSKITCCSFNEKNMPARKERG